MEEQRLQNESNRVRYRKMLSETKETFPVVKHIDFRYLKKLTQKHIYEQKKCSYPKSTIIVAVVNCKTSVMSDFMRENQPFVPHIGSLSLCSWIT